MKFNKITVYPADRFDENSWSRLKKAPAFSLQSRIKWDNINNYLFGDAPLKMSSGLFLSFIFLQWHHRQRVSFFLNKLSLSSHASNMTFFKRFMLPSSSNNGLLIRKKLTLFKFLNFLSLQSYWKNRQQESEACSKIRGLESFFLDIFKVLLKRIKSDLFWIKANKF